MGHMVPVPVRPKQKLHIFRKSKEKERGRRKERREGEKDGREEGRGREERKKGRREEGKLPIPCQGSSLLDCPRACIPQTPAPPP